MLVPLSHAISKPLEDGGTRLEAKAAVARSGIAGLIAKNGENSTAAFSSSPMQVQ